MGILDFFFVFECYISYFRKLYMLKSSSFQFLKKTCWQSSVILHGGDLKLEEPFIHFI